MDQRPIRSLSVSVIGVGTNTFGNQFGGSVSPRDVAEVVGQALDSGVTLFDTAPLYGASEALLGAALGKRRHEAVISTKFGWQSRGAGSVDGVRTAAEASLRALGTDYIDVFLLHSPDPTTPIAVTLAALADLVASGKVREVGLCNVTEAQIRQARADGSLAVVQNGFSLMQQGDEEAVLPSCVEAGLSYVAHTPLASGLLTGKYARGLPIPANSRLVSWGELGAQLIRLDDDVREHLDALEAWAADHGRSLLDLALAWVLAHAPVVSVIAGVTSADQLLRNVGAASWRLTPGEVDEVRRLVPLYSQPSPVADPQADEMGDA